MAVSLLLCRLPFEQDVEQGNVAHLGDCDGKRNDESVRVCPQVSKLMALLREGQHSKGSGRAWCVRFTPKKNPQINTREKSQSASVLCSFSVLSRVTTNLNTET